MCIEHLSVNLIETHPIPPGFRYVWRTPATAQLFSPNLSLWTALYIFGRGWLLLTRANTDLALY
jgi:hypothetical protein